MVSKYGKSYVKCETRKRMMWRDREKPSAFRDNDKWRIDERKFQEKQIWIRLEKYKAQGTPIHQLVWLLSIHLSLSNMMGMCLICFAIPIRNRKQANYVNIHIHIHRRLKIISKYGIWLLRIWIVASRNSNLNEV